MIIILLFISMLYPVSQIASSLTEQDHKNLLKVKSNQYILYESYLDNTEDRGIASVFGYHYDTFLNNNVFYSIAIFGAVQGKRGGYGIATIGGGYEKQISDKINFHLKGLFGSGGGGGIPAGGGLAFSGQVGLSVKLSDKFALTSNFGHLSFPNGTFNTNIINIGLIYQTLKLSLPYK